MIDQEAITEFKELYLREYGVRLTNEQALDYATRFVGLVKAVYGKNLHKIDLTKKKERVRNGTGGN